MHCKLQHKTTPADIAYTGLKVKGRKKSKTKILSLCRKNRMIHAIKFCQDATRFESTKMKPPFMHFDEPNLCNDNI